MKEFVTIGELIKEIIKSSGLKQYEVAEKIGKTPRFLSMIINGDRKASIELLSEISKVCGFELTINIKKDDQLFSLRLNE